MALPSGKIVAEKCGTIVIDSEKSYQIIFDDYLSAKDSVEVFIQRFMTTGEGTATLIRRIMKSLGDSLTVSLPLATALKKTLQLTSRYRKRN